VSIKQGGGYNNAWLGLLLLVTSIIYFYLAVHFGHGAWRTDTWFHLMRIGDLNIATRQHRLPDVVNITSFLGLGQAFNAMYPPYFLYILVALTNELNGLLQWYAIQAIIVLIGLLLAGYGFRRAGGNLMTSYLFSVVTVLSQGYIAYMDNGSLGMMIGSVMLPGALIATYNVAKNHQYCDILSLSVPVAVTLNSHLATAVLMVIVIIALTIWQSTSARSWRLFFSFCLAGIMALLMSAPAWLLPIIMAPSHLSSVRLIPLKGSGILSIIERTFILNKFSLMSWLGLAALVYVPVSALKHRHFKDSGPYYVVGLIIFYLSTNLFPWQVMPQKIADVLQGVEWRLLAMAASALVVAGFLQYLTTAPLINHIQKKGLFFVTLVGFIVPTVGSMMSIGIDNRKLPEWQPKDGYYRHTDTVLTPASFKTDEFYRLRWYTDYLPLTKPEASFEAQSSVAAHQADINQQSVRVGRLVTPSTHAITFLLSSTANQWIDLPFWYYSSLHYQITNVQHVKQSNRGSIMVKVAPRSKKITINQVTTPIYKPSIVIMVLAWLGSLIGLVRPIRDKIHFSS